MNQQRRQKSTVMLLPCICLHISRIGHYSPYDVPKILEHVRTRSHIPLREAERAIDKQYNIDGLIDGSLLTLVIHEASTEFLKGSAVAHGPERAVELVVGHHQVLGVTSHVDHLQFNRDIIVPNTVLRYKIHC